MNDWWTCDGTEHVAAAPEGPEAAPQSSLSLGRRAFLAAGASALLLGLSTKTALSQISISRKGMGKTLVIVFLRGGADGLNIVAPYAEGEYYKLRPGLGLASPTDGKAAVGDRLLDLDGFFGLHPSMSSLYPLFKEGKVAAVHAVGSADQSRSHFEAMSAVERGVTHAGIAEDSGWVARYLNETRGKDPSPLRAVAISSTVPDAFRGATEGVTVSSLEDYKLSAPSNIREALMQLYRGDDQVSRAGAATLHTIDTVEKLDVKNYRASRGAVYPASDLGQALRQTAALISSDLGLEVALLDKGGWDTHVAQGGSTGWMAALLKDVSDSLAAFHQDLGARMKDVSVVVLSEFGRRAYENSGLGTDHGRAGVAFVMGGNTAGGKVYGKWPGLKEGQLEEPGDLRVTSDYRSLLGEVLTKHLKAPRDVFGVGRSGWLNLMQA